MKYTGVTCVAVVPASFKQRGKKRGAGWVPHPGPFSALPARHVRFYRIARTHNSEQATSMCSTRVTFSRLGYF